MLVIRHGPYRALERLKPVAVMCWHAHPGNWPLTVLDMGYRHGLDTRLGRLVVTRYLLAALADLNDDSHFRDTRVDRPQDRLGWAIRRQDGAGSDPGWARTVAIRAQTQWGFTVVKPKSSRPSWARDGFYAERPR